MGADPSHVDRHHIEFLVFDHMSLETRAAEGWPFDRCRRPAVDALMDVAERLSARYAEHAAAFDAQGCSLDADGRVAIPDGVAELHALHARDWLARPELDDCPPVLAALVSESLVGTNPALATYGGFTGSARKLIERAGTPAQRESLLPPLASGAWDACLCITEQEAGSDLTAIRTRGRRREDDVVEVEGAKLFITAGRHDLTENTLYIVLGQIAEELRDTHALSCFLVPRFWPENGRLVDNHVSCDALPDKTGFRGSPNPTLAFGRTGRTRGWLLGNTANGGLLQLAGMMRSARVRTGLFAVGIAAGAYRHSLSFARSRRQGRPLDRAANLSVPRVAIVEHADVQAMLMEMKARVEGGRGLLARQTWHVTLAERAARSSPAGASAPEARRHSALARLLTPVVKAGLSENAARVCSLAVQLHGGRGYLAGWPVERSLRDVRVLSLWEGTNYIQAQNLFVHQLKLGRDTATLGALTADVRDAAETAIADGFLVAENLRLLGALEAFEAAVAGLAGRAADAGVGRVSRVFTRLLYALTDILTAASLLEQARTAERCLARAENEAERRRRWQGTIAAARWFADEQLPLAAAQVAICATAHERREECLADVL